MYKQAIENTRRFLFDPKVRLESTLPWSLKKTGGIYLMSLLFYAAGNVLAVAVMIAIAFILSNNNPELLLSLTGKGQYGFFMAAIIVATFLTGFAAQIWYLSRRVKKDGHKITDMLGLNLKSLNGSWIKAFGLGIAVFAVGWVVTTLLEFIPVPNLHDPALDLLKSLDTWSFILVAFLAIIPGPFLEEVVFRGFLYGSLRTSLQSKVKRQGLRDALAALISGSVFAIMHMNPSAFLIYLGMGYVFAEAYRRTGSLWPSIIGHCINNGIAVLLFVMTGSGTA